MVGPILVHVCMGGEAVMMGLAWKSLESRIRRDSNFRRQMIETYRKAVRDNPHLGEEIDVFLMKLGIQAEVRSRAPGEAGAIQPVEVRFGKGVAPAR